MRSCCEAASGPVVETAVGFRYTALSGHGSTGLLGCATVQAGAFGRQMIHRLGFPNPDRQEGDHLGKPQVRFLMGAVRKHPGPA